jgi:hypothetical protein
MRLQASFETALQRLGFRQRPVQMPMWCYPSVEHRVDPGAAHRVRLGRVLDGGTK